MPASKEYFQEYYLTRKRKLLVILGGEDYCCVKCGYRGDDLEFDHVDPETKSFTIGTRIMQGWKGAKLGEILNELKKCQLLCTRCHLAKTIIQLSVERDWAHGTYYAVQKKKCRCDACDAFRREYYDNRNERRREAAGAASRGPRAPYGRPAEHGSYLRYKRGCKCDECRAANTLRVKDRRKVTQ